MGQKQAKPPTKFWQREEGWQSSRPSLHSSTSTQAWAGGVPRNPGEQRHAPVLLSQSASRPHSSLLRHFVARGGSAGAGEVVTRREKVSLVVFEGSVAVIGFTVSSRVVYLRFLSSVVVGGAFPVEEVSGPPVDSEGGGSVDVVSSGFTPSLVIVVLGVVAFFVVEEMLELSVDGASVVFVVEGVASGVVALEEVKPSVDSVKGSLVVLSVFGSSETVVEEEVEDASVEEEEGC